MLTLTPTASEVVRALVDNGTDDADGGLRLATAGSVGNDVGIAIAGSPEPTDAVIEESGARVFLDEGAVMLLDEMVLDASVEPGGAVQFEISPQAATPGGETV